MRKIIGAAGVLLALAAALGLALGFLGPVSFDFDGFAHVRPHVSVALLVASLLMIAARWRRLALAPLLAGAFGLMALGPIWRSPSALPADCPHAAFTVATANVHHNTREPDAVVAALLATDADIIAVQELSDAFWPAVAPLLAEYPHYALEADLAEYPRGAGLFSKRPIRVLEVVWGDEPELHRALAVAVVAGREIGVASFHFDRPWIEPQAEQVLGFDAYVAALPEPRILLGDFNATPWSYAVSEIEARGAVEIAPGLRRTWKRVYPNPFFGPDIPEPIGNQIDHVFLSPGLGVASVETFDLPGSPHWGVTAVVQIPADPAGC